MLHAEHLSYQMHNNLIVWESKRACIYLFNVYFKGIVSPEGIDEIHTLIT
jgi:hypothetical protein